MSRTFQFTTALIKHTCNAFVAALYIDALCPNSMLTTVLGLLLRS